MEEKRKHGRRGLVSERHWEQGQHFGNCTGKWGRKLRAKRNITEGRLRLGKNHPSTCRVADRKGGTGQRREERQHYLEHLLSICSFTKLTHLVLKSTLPGEYHVIFIFTLGMGNWDTNGLFSLHTSLPLALAYSTPGELASLLFFNQQSTPHHRWCTHRVPPPNICMACPSPPQGCVQRSCSQNSLPDRRLPTSFFLIAHILHNLVIYLLSLCPSIRR